MPAVDQTHVVSNSLGLPVASQMQIKYKLNANFDFFFCSTKIKKLQNAKKIGLEIGGGAGGGG